MLQTFFRIMHEENLLPYDFSGHIVTPKKLVHLPKNIPSQDEMRTIIQSVVPDNPLGMRDRFLLELMYATAIRNTELRTLKIHDLNIHDRTLFISGKGGAERIVPIGEWVVPYAKEYLQKGRPYLIRLTKTDLLFPTRRGKQIDTSMLHQIVNFYCKKAGMQIRISPHMFRHACATHMLQQGADIRYVQELLGHRDLGCTAIYTKVTIGDLRKAHAKYHPANRDDF
jgi:integrase/recombinase XerD